MTWPSFISSLVELEQARRDGGQPQALPHRRYRDVEAGGDLFLVEPLLAQRHYTAKLVQRMHSKVIFKWPVSWMTLILRSFWLRLVFLCIFGVEAQPLGVNHDGFLDGSDSRPLMRVVLCQSLC